MRHYLGIGLVGLILLTGCGSSPIVADTTLALGTDDESSALSQGLLNAYETSFGSTTLTLQHASRDQVIQAVLDGELNAGIIFLPPADSDVFYTPVGQDSLVLITHPDTSVEGLASGEVRDVFTGRTVNWSQLGGPDEMIALVTYPVGESGRLGLEQFLQDLPLQSSARIVSDSHTMRGFVAATPYSIGYLPYSQIDTSIQPLAIDGVLPTLQAARNRSYPFLIQVVFIADGEPAGEVRDFLNWILSPNGQRVVRRHMLTFDD